MFQIFCFKILLLQLLLLFQCQVKIQNLNKGFATCGEFKSLSASRLLDKWFTAQFLLLHLSARHVEMLPWHQNQIKFEV